MVYNQSDTYLKVHVKCLDGQTEAIRDNEILNRANEEGTEVIWKIKLFKKFKITGIIGRFKPLYYMKNDNNRKILGAS